MSTLLLQMAPAQLLTTLDRVKAELGISDTSSDDLLVDIIARASSAIARYCNRPYGFGQIRVQETLKGTGSQILGLTYVPVLQIDSIYRDTELMTQVDPGAFLTTPNFSEGYYIEDADSGAIYCAEGWGQTVALMSWGWEAYASRYILPGGTLTQRYTATYTAGYFLPGQELPALQDRLTGNDFLFDPTYNPALPFAADAPPLPGDVEQACLVTVKSWWFSRKRDVSIGTERTLDEQTQYLPAFAQTGALPFTAIGMLRDYRRVM